MSREVTEQDFRMPEFRNAKVEDYEFREDGKLVRKDRWEMGINSIRCLVYDKRDWEISDVIDAVGKLAKDADGWDNEKPHRNKTIADIRLSDGSILRKAQYVLRSDSWTWQNSTVVLPVDQWKELSDD